MEFLPNLIFIFIIGSVVLFFHKGIDRYPEPLEQSEIPYKELEQVFFLWLMGLIIPVTRIFIFTPWLENIFTSRSIRELVQLPLLTIIYLILPALLVIRLNKWKISDLGIKINVRSKPIAISAVIFGVVTGTTAYLTNETIIDIEVFSPLVFILLLFNNDFLEEFFYRGIIQSKLERIIGQNRAVFVSGILFGLTHIVFDFVMLSDKGIYFIISAFILQVIAGWLLGIIYMKTRSLWPGVICHYLSNWLPAILKGIFN